MWRWKIADRDWASCYFDIVIVAHEIKVMKRKLSSTTWRHKKKIFLRDRVIC